MDVRECVVSWRETLWNTLDVYSGRLWATVDRALGQGEPPDSYRKRAFVNTIAVKALCSTDLDLNAKLLRGPRYGGTKTDGGRAWKTSSIICKTNNILLLTGERRRLLHRLMQPFFTSSYIRGTAFPIMLDWTQKQVENWSQKTSIPIVKATNEHACLIISRVYLGIDTQYDAELLSSLRSLFSIFNQTSRLHLKANLLHAFRPIFEWLYERTGLDIDGYHTSHAIMNEIFKKTILAANPPSDNFLGALAEADITEDERLDTLKVLYAAGTETSGSLSATLLYLLATHKEVAEEIRSQLKDPLTWEQLQSNHLLEAACLEALRLAPPLSGQIRQVLTDEFGYPPKTTVLMSHYHHNRDSKNYADPLTFNPKRFLRPDGSVDENMKRKIWLAFGQGSNLCIGRYLGWNMVKTIGAVMLLKADFDAKQEKPIPLDRQTTTALSSTVEMTVKARQPATRA